MFNPSYGLPWVFKIKILYFYLILDHICLEGQKPAKNRYKINYILGYEHGCWIYAKLRKVQAFYAQQFISRASSDTYMKWLLGPDQDLVFTFSNPALKSVL